MAIVVLAASIMPLPVLLVIFPSIIDDINDDVRDVVSVGDGGGVCWNPVIIISVLLILFHIMRVCFRFIPVKSFFRHGEERVLIRRYLLFLDVVIVFILFFIISVVFLITILAEQVLSEVFFTSCALVKVAVRMLEVDVSTRNDNIVFLSWGDRKLGSCNRGVVWISIVFCRINALRNEVLF